MKKILSILLISISNIVACQTSSDVNIELTGIWTLTDYNDPNKFEDTWEFTSDSLFNELKHKSDGDTTLVPDENGIWSLKANKLSIIITGENTRGKQKLYKKSQVIYFGITKEGEDYLLSVISDGGASDGDTIKLRLTKK